MAGPSFLSLPARRSKPRTAGLTHVLDKGMSAQATSALLDSAGDYIDVWKCGWGTAYLDRALGPKLEALAGRDVIACLGGTLLEIAWMQGKAAECLAWAGDAGFAAVEVSRGVAPMTMIDKRKLIETATESFIVFAEVGRKDGREQLSAQQWAEEIAADRDSGARRIIIEGRESGTVGIYHGDGSVRAEIVAAVTGAVEAPLTTLLFEAPRKDQQTWFIREFGPDVNLANIALDEVIALETLRLGLRADTVALNPEWQPA